jgi:hypothetical protein
VEQDRYSYSPIVDRPPLEWPGGKRVAFRVGLNIEHVLLDRPSTTIASVTAALAPDPMNYGWRYLAKILAEVRSRDEVWVTTSDAIAAHYLTTEHYRTLAGS